MKVQNPATSVPLGTILAFALDINYIPSGWLLCDGSTIPSNYSELIKVFGSDTLPNLTGRTLIGSGTQYALNSQGGEEKVTLSIDEMPNHSHSYSQYTGNNVESGDGNDHSPNFTAFNSNGQTGSAGGSKSHNNMQPYYVVNYIIYAG